MNKTSIIVKIYTVLCIKVNSQLSTLNLINLPVISFSSKFYKVSLSILFLLLINLQTSAQQMPFATLSIADGLEDTVIFSIEEDDLGFLWIASRTGINRYDGKQFWTYGRNDGLPHNLARDLLKTKDGTLWIATEKGLAWFDGKSFHVFKPKNKKINTYSARALSQAPDGTLWVATYGAGVLQLEIGENPKLIKQYNYKNGLKTDRIRSILADKQGNIWVGTSKYIFKINEKKVEQIQWHAKKSEIRTIFQHKDNSIWVGTRFGIARYNGKAFEALKFNVDLSQQTINSIMYDFQGFIWVGSRDFGTYKIDQNNKIIKHFEMRDGLPDNSINEIFQDQEHNLWFGTYGGGLTRLSTTNVLNWKTQPGLPNPNVYTITNDKKNCLWVGTNGNGASHICNKEITHYTRKQGLSHNKILSIMVDNKGIAWFGTLQGMSQLIDGKFIHFDQDQGLSGSVIYHIIQTSDNSMWIGTNNGLNHFDGQNFYTYTTREGLPHNRINRIIESREGGLWLASSYGLTYFKDEQFTSWSTTDGLPANFINDFYEDDKGGLWIATNNGLSYFKDNKFTNWSKKDGLPHNNATVILPGKGDGIWIGTSRGVAIFDGENFTIISSREGLVFDLINRGAGYKDPKGNLWFGTGEGISRFAKDFKIGGSDEPPVHILSINNNQNPLDLSAPSEIKQQDSSLLIKFAAISFQRASDITYRYRFNNQINTPTPWRETRLRELQIDSLTAGDYTFEVSARVGNGQWNTHPAQYQITVIPPFWKTKWFIILVGFAILAAFITRNYRSKKYALKLENIVQERTKELNEVNKGLEWLANHDNLTQLANRNYIHSKLEVIKKTGEAQATGFILIDLDHFKSVNDKYGHEIGDKALKIFADMLRSIVNTSQIAARWGGEEFLIVSPSTNLAELSQLTQDILIKCRAINIEISQEEHLILRCSLGYALTPSKAKHSCDEKTIQLADLALYEAKNNGRDCAVGFVWKTHPSDKWKFHTILDDLDGAIKNDIIERVLIP